MAVARQLTFPSVSYTHLKEKRVEELEREMEAPDFWDNAEISQKKMKELKSMKDDMETYHNLVTQMDDMETMIEMGYEENDPDLIPEIQEMLDEFRTDFDNIRVKTLLSGEYDSENAIIKLNAGAGGTEACDWCGMLYLSLIHIFRCRRLSGKL